MQAPGAIVRGPLMPINVVFRCDASIEIGTGHVMRCLALAESLRHRGVSSSFVCRELPGNLCELIESEHFVVHHLRASAGETDGAACGGACWQADAEQTQAFLATAAQPCDWLVVDHYGLDAQWEGRMRERALGIMVIDDLADRPHDCDLLLDQNLQWNPNSRYRDLVPANCQTLLGPQYALLRPEFREARSKLRTRNGKVGRILVFFGGTDPSNETEKALEAIRQVGRPEIVVDVVVGRNNPHRRKLRSLCESLPNSLLNCQVNDMAERMARADLGIGAGGITTWERCFLGLPSITVAIAPNQHESLENAAAVGCVVNLGWGGTVSRQQLSDVLSTLVNDPARLREMTRRCIDITGRGQGQDELVRHILQVSHA